MKVFFSFDYKGGSAYLGMKGQTTMMDVKVVDNENLIDFLELRLGLHTVTLSESERLVGYYKCVREYMKLHPDNQLYSSYTVSPLAASREMLKWRDALAFCGWSKDTPAPSDRLKVLQGVEQIFAEKVEQIFAGKKYSDMSTRLNAIRKRLEQKKGMMNDVTFVMPFDKELLHPVLKEIFSLAEADGAQIERLEIPEIEGNNDLAKLKRLLTAESTEKTAENTELIGNDGSVRIWHFKDNMEAEEYLAMEDDEFDVCINSDTKLTDNYLHMMGKPVTGSSVANTAPQIIQLFFSGVAMLARPLNIQALLQWLYAPIHPLPGKIRYRLANQLARKGGWLPEDKNADNDDDPDCYQLVKEWIDGKVDEEKEQPIDDEEREKRRHTVSVFLPDFEDSQSTTIDDNLPTTIELQQLHTFLTELGKWSRQYSTILKQENPNDLRIPQLNRLSELCETMKELTNNDFEPTAKVEYSEIEKYLSCLYEPSEFGQYKAQAKSRFTVSIPGQVAAKADNVLWGGLYNFEPMLPDTDFLTPTELKELKNSLKLWDADSARQAQQQTLLLPLRFCQNQLTLITVDNVDGDIVNKHPMMVRIEQQVKNIEELTIAQKIDEDQYISEKVLDNAKGDDNKKVLYAKIKRTDLIKWREQESQTSIENLIQNPIDYTLEYIANIKDYGQSELSDINQTKGNVAHAVIQHLFYIPEDKHSGKVDAIKQRVESNYEKEFNHIVKTKGAILLLQENAIERRMLFVQLRECIEHLIDIIEQDDLRVVGYEKELVGSTLGKPDEETPSIHGFADMVLARETGQRVIFDFKWTGSKTYHQKLLQKNRSLQLAIYANLQAGCESTAYFLMPVGELVSTEDFKSHYAKRIDVNEGCEGDIIGKIKASYRYRRNEIMSGQIEMGEEMPLEDLNYAKDTEPKNLLPLKRLEKGKKEEDKKEVYMFSDYKIFKVLSKTTEEDE